MSFDVAEKLIEHAQNGILIYISKGMLKVNDPEGKLIERERLKLKNNKELILKFFAAWGVKSNDNIGFLSYQQQRLWLIDKIEPGSTQYNLPSALKFDGKLDPNAMRRALSAILDRHPTLRTVYKLDDQGEGIQVIREAVELALPIVDLSHLVGAEQVREVSRLTAAEASLPFDLASDLMLRATLLKLAAESWVLLWTMHHIAADGWSQGVLTGDLSALYAAALQGQENPLPPLHIQYIDYAHWQRHWMQGEVLARQLEYWSRHLRGLPLVHNLPLDHARAAVPTYRGGMISQFLGSELRRDLNAFSQSHGVTLFMVLHAAFVSLLSRYSGEHDIVVGNPVAGREQAELASLVGLFVNTLVLRSDLSDDPSFADLLTQSKERLLAAYEHQQIPFEKLVNELKPERSLSHNPLFQVMLVLHNNEQTQMNLPGLTLRSAEGTGKSSKFDLTLNITEDHKRNGMYLLWEYSADLFEASTIERMAGHFEVLLKSAIENPDFKVSKLPLLTAAEQNTLLEEWNATEMEYPQDKCIHELFEEQARRDPEAVAVVYEDRELTYGELNAQANRLAHYLIEERGVKPDSLVGICVERSLEMVVGILGILKAGGAYVPLDPEYPEQRVQYMLEDAGLGTVLTQKHVRAKLGIGEERAVCLEDEAFQQRLAKHKATNLSARHLGLTPDHLAYVIYTSGSTGKPKGVAIEHHSPVALIYWAMSVYSRKELAGVLAATSICFDLSVYEIFVTLANGGKIILVSNILELSNLSNKESITLINTVPSAITELIKLKAIPDSVQTINLAGEPLLPALVDKLYTESAVQKVYDLYGPSEDTTYSTFILRKKNSRQTIGRPIANTRVYILDRYGGLRPIGVPGELHIGGVGLARGYLNNPELTRERFIENPFYDKDDPMSSKQLYKTGDLVRWLPDGNLEFLGRMDHQVKIRGFRIELGEIEHALRGQPEIKEAVVVAHARDGGDKYLVAYVAPQALSDLAGCVHLDHEVLRQALRTKLPEYMVPSYFVEFDALPLTPNGKVDRKALLPPDASQLQTKAYVAPNTEAEKQLVQIWSKVLNVPAGKIGMQDNFFELGGDSLLAMQLVSKARQAGIGITLKQILGAGTLAELALMDNAGMNAANNAPIVGDMPLTIDQAVFLAYDYHMPHWCSIVYQCEQIETFDLAILDEAVNALLTHHDAMRARFTQEDGVWRQTLDEPRRHKIVSTVDLSHMDSDAAEQQINDIACDLARFDISTGPLIKIVQIDVGAGRPKRLVIAASHLIADGVSMHIVMEDIATAYRQLLANRPVELPEKTTPVKEWIARLEEYANSDELKQEAHYWLSLPWSDMRKLPVEFPGGEYRRYEGSLLETRISLSEQDTLRIMNGLPRHYGVSTFDAITAALVATLSAWTQSDNVPLCVIDSGRNVLPDMQGIDLSRTVGWLSYPRLVFLQKPKTEDVSSLLKSVSLQLKALPNQGFGFGILSTYNKDKTVRDRLRAIPVPQVWLNYTGVHAMETKGLGLIPQIPLDKITWTPPGGAPRKIDMTWIHPDNQQAWHILLHSGIWKNRFYMHWRYSGNLYRRETIEALTENYLAVLRAMAALPV